MNERDNKSSDSKFIEAYNRMLAHVRDAYEEAERHTLPALQHAIDVAIDKTAELGELTRAEAERIGDYLKRDIEDAAAYIAGPQGKEFSDWLKIDVTLMEKEILDLFFSVADKTKVELAQWELQAANSDDTYRSGEITGIGTLQCNKCNEVLRFTTTDKIPECPKCGGTEFRRVRDEA